MQQRVVVRQHAVTLTPSVSQTGSWATQECLHTIDQRGVRLFGNALDPQSHWVEVIDRFGESDHNLAGNRMLGKQGRRKLAAVVYDLFPLST